MERQLMDHLNSEADYDFFCENVMAEFDPTLWDNGLSDFFEKEPKVNEFIEHCYSNGHDEKYCANGITELYKIHTI